MLYSLRYDLLYESVTKSHSGKMNVHLHCVRADLIDTSDALIRFQFNYQKEMARRSSIVVLSSSTHSNSSVERKTISGRSFDGARGPPFLRPDSPRQRPVDPGAHEFLLKAAISLSPDKSWWVIRRHQSRCQRRPRRGPHRLPIHKSGTHVWMCTYTGTARRTNFFGTFLRQTAGPLLC